MIAHSNPEADSLRERITQAEEDFDVVLAIWSAQADPIRKRLVLAEEWALLSGEWKDYRVAKRDLENLEPMPVEPISLGLLRGRLAAAEAKA